MGNYRFRLSDMIPNAWFYKLKEMNKTRNWKNANPSKKKQTPSSVAQPIQPSITTQLSHLSDQRKSYYFTRDLNPEPNNLTSSPSTTRVCGKKIPEPPRKSSRRRRSTKRIRNSSVRPSSSSRLVTDTSISTGCRCESNVESVWTKPDSTPEEYPDSPNGSSSSENESLLPEYGSDKDTFDDTLSWSTSRIENDIIIDMENRKPFNAKSDATDHKLNGFENLPPIITRQSKTGDTEKVTKPTETTNSTKILRTSAKDEEKNAFRSLSVKVVKEDILSNNPKQHKITTSPVRRLQPGLKLRTNSPRLAASLRIQGRKGAVSTSSSSSSSRRSVSGSFAIVKSSQNPQRDFRESMVEMIVENNIRASKDLEELLACYLSLNSDEYHDLIISVFKQIWFDIIDI